MRKKTLTEIQKHAIECYPRECCGVVILDGKKERYYPCTNTAQGFDDFKMDAGDYAAAEDIGKIVAIVHSHPDASDHPSVGDLVSCEASSLPWYIIAVTKEGAADNLRRIEPTGYKAPLIGREFNHGTTDCYTLVQDFYKRVLNIDLPNFEREDNWWNQGQNLYMDNLEKAGFRKIEKEEPIAFGDMILMQIRSPVANHAGVFIGAVKELDGQKLFPVQNGFIHHLYGYCSKHEIYGGQWAESTLAICRHKNND